MARGRGSAMRGAVAVAFLAVVVSCIFLSGCGVADATTYYVGDSLGWSLGSGSWPSGKKFHAGDILVFRYLPWMHNVVAVDEDGYADCNPPPFSRYYTSGSDSVRLARGDNFFVCTRYGHCNLGMKMVVTAV
uniref:Plantacyanin n=1 Tax=Oryza glumipatula TaxID=40148 RepID=A0A0D9ZCA4_9ORYZ